jgi:hypothetical protein
MYLKIHRSAGAGDIVAVCDRELMNTTICHDKISIPISEHFYGNQIATEEEVRKALKNACNINLMGERATAIAIEMGLTTKDCCIMIGRVPHAQIF